MASLHNSSGQEYVDPAVASHQASGVSCDRLRQELKKCLKESDCVQVHCRSAKDCVNAHDGTVPDRCFTLLSNFSDCKRSLVDMRSRFRGRKGDL
uniref:Cytochrome c oxidase assembly factor 5 n=1 Tax=Steinernema glaseri TaxID=37863 RepID=A0A1I8ABB6_9BILA